MGDEIEINRQDLNPSLPSLGYSKDIESPLSTSIRLNLSSIDIPTHDGEEALRFGNRLEAKQLL